MTYIVPFYPMKMIVNAMVNGDEVCATAVQEEEDNQEEEEDLDVVMLEVNEAASAQKEILKKTTDYLLRHQMNVPLHLVILNDLFPSKLLVAVVAVVAVVFDRHSSHLFVVLYYIFLLLLLVLLVQ